MSRMSEPEMAVKLNPDGQVLCANMELVKVVKFKPKIGSVIPAKRVSVKRMMFDYLAQSIAQLVRPRRPPSSSAATQSGKPNSSSFKKSKPIYPQTP
jgi:hypothetical protein